MPRGPVYVGSQRPRHRWRPSANDQARAGGLVVLVFLPRPQRAHRILLVAHAQGCGDARRDLDQQAHAVAAGSGAEGVAAIVVEERRAEHVDMSPLDAPREALEERGGRDRIAVRAPGRVLQVRDLRLDQLLVPRMQRPRPREVPDADAGVDDCVAPVVVVAEDAGEEVAHPGPHRPRERREVDHLRRALAPRVPEGVGEDQAALGVGVRDLHGQPRRGLDHVRRPDRVGTDHVLARGDDARHRHGELELGDGAHRGEHGGPAGHVALLTHDVGLGLEEVAARVEGHGLADEPEVRGARRALGLVAEHDEPRRRGARAAHGGERGEAGGGCVDDLDAHARDRGRALDELLRPDDVRRRVDELARDVGPARDDLGPGRGPEELVVHAADDEALDGGLGRLALPEPRVVAAEHGALDDRLKLALLGHRQRVVERPHERPRPAAGAHGAGRRGPQVLRVEPIGRDEEDPPRAQLAADMDDRDRIRVRRRAREPPLEQRIELADEQAARDEGEGIGLDLGRSSGGDLDVHPPLLSIGQTAVAVRVRVLGSAAGGGFPQWNCRCPTCEAARAGVEARPRTQSSIAIRGAEGPWLLANASPDLRQQLEGLAAQPTDGVRAAPVAGVLLTDAEIDHTAGLLLLRESSTPIPVYGSEQVRRALTDGYPVLPILEGYSGAQWRTLDPGDSLALDGTSLAVESFAAGGDAPRYLAGTGADVEAAGLVFRDTVTGGVLTYVPGLARLDDDVRRRMAESDVVLVDGTFWRDDELALLGISDRTARQMGHVPLSGDDGSLRALAALERPRVVLVHINNTNPILLERSPEREAVLRAGVEIADDGLEIAI